MSISDKTKMSITIGTFILTIVFIMSATFTLATWTSKVENEIDITKTDVKRIEECEKEYGERITDLEDSDVLQTVQFAEIKKDLEYIKAMILNLSEEIK